MGNLFATSHQSTRSSGLLVTTSVVAVPSTSLQGGTTLPPPPSPAPRNDKGEEALLQKVIQGLRRHVPELYRQLRSGTEFDPDVLKIILDIVDKASGGMPWPVALAIQAVLLLADNALKVHDSAAAEESLASTFGELKRKLQSLEGLGVRDEDEDQVKDITAKLIAASAIVDDIVGKASSTRTCGTCFHAFVCAQCNARKLSDVSANLEKCLGKIRDILTDIIAYRTERPCDKAPELPSHLFQMEEPVSKVMGFLRDSGGSTRVVGLHGQGGIGKTTLMRVVEANLRSDSGCRTTHKIASVEVGMQPPALKKLQKSLYSQLSDGSNESFSSEAQGRVVLKEVMEGLKSRGKKICIFLDNVWRLEHLKELLPQPDDLADALPHGSYLFISSRSASVAAKLAGMCFKTEREETEGYLGYQLSMLPKQDAENLFLRMASREEEVKPLQRDDELVQAIVPLCDGLPLALTVYGSIFKDGKRRNPDVWKRVIEQLERAEDPRFADDRMFEKLKASVNFQDERLQDAFIDVAHLCRSDPFGISTDYVFCAGGEALELVMEEADDLEYLVDQSLVTRRLVMEEEDDLQLLADQSLVTRRGDEVVIHDLLLNVAKQMAKERNIRFVTEDTREDEIAELLLPHPEVVTSIRAFDESVWCRHAKESYPSSAQIQDVRYLIMDATEWQRHLRVSQHREFQVMITNHCHKLRVLAVDTLVQEQLSWITNLRQLRWLSVEDDSLAGISKISSQIRVFNACLRSNNSHDFLSSLLEASFTTLRGLRIQGLEDAVRLKWVGQLASLTRLDLSGCKSLTELPKELGQLGSLKTLNLWDCTSLTGLPKEVGQLGSLTELNLSQCKSLAELPEELGQLGSLKWLFLFQCTSLSELPEELGQLGTLKTLYLEGCTSLAELPKELGQLRSLKELYLGGCTSLTELPKELGQLGSLTCLDLSGCTSLAEELPEGLEHLGSLTVYI